MTALAALAVDFDGVAIDHARAAGNLGGPCGKRDSRDQKANGEGTHGAGIIAQRERKYGACQERMRSGAGNGGRPDKVPGGPAGAALEAAGSRTPWGGRQ